VQQLVWDQAFDSGFFVSALFLNNSDDSQHGPGTFLDRRATPLGFPFYDPIVDAPGNDFFVQSRFGDSGYSVRFGVRFNRMDLMEPGAVYGIAWQTPPGDADVDNASWEFGAGEHLGSIPILLSRCWVTRETWGVDPIQDGAIHTFDAVSHCYRNLFVSWIWR
jgi:hypothetical protein